MHKYVQLSWHICVISSMFPSKMHFVPILMQCLHAHYNICKIVMIPPAHQPPPSPFSLYHVTYIYKNSIYDDTFCRHILHFHYAKFSLNLSLLFLFPPVCCCAVSALSPHSTHIMLLDFEIKFIYFIAFPLYSLYRKIEQNHGNSTLLMV